MANKVITKDMLTTQQYLTALENSKLIQYWRSHPVDACRDLLGIELLDFQKVVLNSTWVAQDAVWLLSRNAGKTVLASIFLQLTQLLFPEQKIFIVSVSGGQAKQLFSYVERLATNQISTFGSLPDIFYQEIKRSHDSLSGFSHDPAGYRVELLHGSYARTLNSNDDANRGHRADLLIFDEIGFMAEESIVSCEPFTTTDSSFQSSTDKYFDPRTLNKNKNNQRLYISSASSKDTYYYQKYREFALSMFAGDRKYFVADLNVEVPLNPTMRGKKVLPLLSRDVVESAKITNYGKYLREYMNKFDEDGGDDQIIKGSTIENNSTFYLPEIIPTDEPNVKYGLFYDSAHVADNSVILVGKFIHDEKRGWYGKVVNLVNFKDINAKFTNRQMTYDEQKEELRKLLVKYNGDGAEYENIHTVSIDSGSGGGGVIYGQSLMYDFTDNRGMSHKGIIDKEYFEDKIRDFPNAYPILRMIEPSKWKNTMVKRTINLMDLGLIEFPKTYNNSGSMDIDTEDSEGNISTIRKKLSKEEELALINIDLCKEETKMIHRYKTASDRIVYRTRTDFAKKMHDDRFYVLIMFGNAVHELRHDEDEKRHKRKKKKDKTILGLFN